MLTYAHLYLLEQAVRQQHNRGLTRDDVDLMLGSIIPDYCGVSLPDKEVVSDDGEGYDKFQTTHNLEHVLGGDGSPSLLQRGIAFHILTDQMTNMDWMTELGESIDLSSYAEDYPAINTISPRRMIQPAVDIMLLFEHKEMLNEYIGWIHDYVSEHYENVQQDLASMFGIDQKTVGQGLSKFLKIFSLERREYEASPKGRQFIFRKEVNGKEVPDTVFSDILLNQVIGPLTKDWDHYQEMTLDAVMSAYGKHINNGLTGESDNKDFVSTRVVIGHPDDSRILLVRQSDTGTWGLPGGGNEPYERLDYTAIREAREEANTPVRIREILGAVIYESKGGKRIFDLIFGGVPESLPVGEHLGTLHSDEIEQMQWATQEEAEILYREQKLRKGIATAYPLYWYFHDFGVNTSMFLNTDFDYHFGDDKVHNETKLIISAFMPYEGGVLYAQDKKGNWGFPGGRYDLSKPPLERLDEIITEQTGLDAKVTGFYGLSHFVGISGAPILNLIYFAQPKESQHLNPTSGVERVLPLSYGEVVELYEQERLRGGWSNVQPYIKFREHARHFDSLMPLGLIKYLISEQLQD